MIDKVCENCGTSFGCHADEPGACWCNDYEVSQNKLKELRERFQNCLCRACLVELGAARPKSGDSPA